MSHLSQEREAIVTLAIQTRWSEGSAKLAQELNLNEKVLKRKAKKLGVFISKRGRLRDAELLERLDDLIKSRYQKEGANLIATELDLSIHQVISRASDIGVHRKENFRKAVKDPIKNEKILEIIRERYPKEGPSLIAKELDMSEASIIIRANRAGIITDVKGRAQRMSNTFSLNHDVLDLSIWDPLTSWGAYYLGLIWADGNVTYKIPDEVINRESQYSVILGLSGEEDHCVIQSLARLLHLDEERIRPVKKYKEHHKLRKELKLSGKRIAGMMIDKYKLLPRKSYIDPPFPNIPDEFLGDFSRGLFDGDGSKVDTVTPVYRIYGTYAFMDEFSDRIVSLLGIRQYALRRHETSLKLFEVGHPEEVQKLFSFMHPDTRGYSDQHPYLPRKHRIFFDFMDGKIQRERTAHSVRDSFVSYEHGTKEVFSYSRE